METLTDKAFKQFGKVLKRPTRESVKALQETVNAIACAVEAHPTTTKEGRRDD